MSDWNTVLERRHAGEEENFHGANEPLDAVPEDELPVVDVPEEVAHATKAPAPRKAATKKTTKATKKAR